MAWRGKSRPNSCRDFWLRSLEYILRTMEGPLISFRLWRNITCISVNNTDNVENGFEVVKTGGFLEHSQESQCHLGKNDDDDGPDSQKKL